jgi:hypothetical protein
MWSGEMKTPWLNSGGFLLLSVRWRVGTFAVLDQFRRIAVAVALHVLIKSDASPGPDQDYLKRGLTALQRFTPKIVSSIRSTGQGSAGLGEDQTRHSYLQDMRRN